MKARMEKYDTVPEVKRRTQKNERLYNEVQSMNIDYVDINVDNAMDLSLPKDSKFSREGYQKQRELDQIIPTSRPRKTVKEYEATPSENRVYDIDEILKIAKDNNLFENEEKKRLINTEYNILTKLDVGSLQNEEMKKEDLRSLIDDIYEKERPSKPKVYSKKEEDRLLSELFEDDDKSNLDEELDLKEELSKQILDNSVSEEKVEEAEPLAVKIEEKKSVDDSKDCSDEKEIKDNVVNEMTDDFIEEKEGKGLLIAIIVVIVLILLTCCFFVYEYFFGV